MRHAWLAVVLILASCGGAKRSESPPASTVVGNAAPAPAEAPPVRKRELPRCRGTRDCTMRVMRYFRDEMCECSARKDKDCAHRVTDEMATWAMNAGNLAPEDEPWTEADEREMDDVGRSLGACTTEAMMPADGSAILATAPASTPKGRQTPVGPAPGPKPACAASKQCSMDLLAWFTDAMCACTTKQCGEDLTDEMAKWAQASANTNTNSSPQSPSAADAKKMEALGTRLGDCTTDVMMNAP